MGGYPRSGDRGSSSKKQINFAVAVPILSDLYLKLYEPRAKTQKITMKINRILAVVRTEVIADLKPFFPNPSSSFPFALFAANSLFLTIYRAL